MTTDRAPSRMFAEAGAIPAIVAGQRRDNALAVARLGANLQANPPRFVTTCARGSSAHAATFARALIEARTGIVTAEQALSSLSVYGGAPKAAGALCLAISQSGMSPDLAIATAAFREAGAATLAFVNDDASSLAAVAETVIPLRAGCENSIAATKSFVAALAATIDVVASWKNDRALSEALDAAPAALDEAWSHAWPALVDELAEASSLFVIGRGYGLATAREAALKLKETCGLHAEAFSAAELRHGPMAMIGRGFPVLVFRQPDATAAGIDALVADLVSIGARVLLVGGRSAGAITLPAAVIAPEIAPMVEIQSFYRAVVDLAAARGFDADHPAHLAKITETV